MTEKDIEQMAALVEAGALTTGAEQQAQDAEWAKNEIPTVIAQVKRLESAFRFRKLAADKAGMELTYKDLLQTRELLGILRSMAGET